MVVFVVSLSGHPHRWEKWVRITLFNKKEKRKEKTVKEAKRKNEKDREMKLLAFFSLFILETLIVLIILSVYLLKPNGSYSRNLRIAIVSFLFGSVSFLLFFISIHLRKDRNDALSILKGCYSTFYFLFLFISSSNGERERFSIRVKIHLIFFNFFPFHKWSKSE